ncbi:hypothetical protein BKA66DRAFT_445598 [Pyrenochaeta sp. MPI-SDFR-AT-0127]|nr:hypothetical protein BKA66DRAFT_445598 [Pyrenochaeta sp. MPI-SDFR-AT-0127]
MGTHPVVIVVEPPKQCRSLSYQRIGRLTRLHGTPEEKPVVTERTCRGPTFLHNALPIVEPLCTLDSRLLLVEDYILGRKSTPCNNVAFPVPSNVEDLKSWVEDTLTPCDCDECAPKLYQLKEDKSHGTIRYQDGTTDAHTKRFSHSWEKTATLLPKLTLKLYGQYEAMRLVRHHVAWLDETYLQHPHGKQNTAALQLQSLLYTWKPHLSGSDLRQSISKTQLQHLFSALNRVFFFSAIPPHRRIFASSMSFLPEGRKTCFGVGYFNPIVGTHVLLHPTMYRHSTDAEDSDVRWRNRVGTLLHEMCHAFLKAYTCRACPMQERCVGARGHGRAWQILAKKVEQVVSGIMGGYVDMGRFPSLLHDMEGHGRVPSNHDLEAYGMDDQSQRQSKSG